jgi:cell envelope opacity-associated protein A
MEVYRALPDRRAINKSVKREIDEHKSSEWKDSQVDVAASEEHRDFSSRDDDYDSEVSFLLPASHVDSPPNDVDMRIWGYVSRPRVLHCDFQSINSKQQTGNDHEATLHAVNRLPAHETQQLRSSERYVTNYPDDDRHLERKKQIKENSKKYRVHEAEPFETETCKAKYDWQTGAFPNCNNLHEFELGQLTSMHGRAMRDGLNVRDGDGDEQVRYWAHGYWRDVWLVSKAIGNDEQIAVLKTLRTKHDFTDRNYDRHRKDALASERLSKSPYVVDIYAYCSNSALFEYGDGGDIDLRIWPYDKKAKKHYVAELSSLEKIDIGKSEYLT